MLISELIEKLQAAAAEHGDLPIVVPGFDESGYDDPVHRDLIGTLRMQKIAGPRSSHGPKYEAADDWRFSSDPLTYARLERDGEPFTAFFIG